MGKEGVTRREALTVAGAMGLAALSGQVVAAEGEGKGPPKGGPAKLFVVTDKNGNVVATGPKGQISHKDGDNEGTIELRPIPLEGQTVHEVELPQGVGNFKSPDELHKAVRDMIRR